MKNVVRKFVGKSKAKKEANRLFAEYGQDKIPVDVNAIADSLGIDIVGFEANNELAGFLIKKNSTSVIAINREHGTQRKRFSIAHELAHHCLHDDSSSEVFFRDERSSKGNNRQEVEANAFAAELLMPEKQVREYAEKYQLDFLDDSWIKELANDFNVSVQAMSIRLQQLGLLTFDEFW